RPSASSKNVTDAQQQRQQRNRSAADHSTDIKRVTHDKRGCGSNSDTDDNTGHDTSYHANNERQETTRKTLVRLVRLKRLVLPDQGLTRKNYPTLIAGKWEITV
ncbi:unnamed protein product, partial [Ectocarpus sp. 13 AM-2016]